MTLPLLDRKSDLVPEGANSLDDTVKMYLSVTKDPTILGLQSASGSPMKNSFTKKLFSTIIGYVARDLDSYLTHHGQDLVLSDTLFLSRGVRKSLSSAPDTGFLLHAFPYVLQELENQYLTEFSGTSSEVLSHIEAKRRLWHAISELPPMSRRVWAEYSGIGRNLFEEDAEGKTLREIADNLGLLDWAVQEYFEQGRKILASNPELQDLNTIYHLKELYEGESETC